MTGEDELARIQWELAALKRDMDGILRRLAPSPSGAYRKLERLRAVVRVIGRVGEDQRKGLLAEAAGLLNDVETEVIRLEGRRA